MSEGQASPPGSAARSPWARRLEAIAAFVIVLAVLGGTIAHCAWRVKRERERRRLADGILSVRSDPPGAFVTVEGRRIAGVTPLFARGVKKGVPLAVEVTLAGYRPWRGTGQVRTDYGDGVLLVKLEPDPTRGLRPLAPPAEPSGSPRPRGAPRAPARPSGSASRPSR